MALGDVVIYDDGTAIPGSKRFKVNNGGPGAIKAGELVLKQLGNGATSSGRYVTVWTAGNAAKPSIGTDFIAGLAASTSTETLTAAGVVDVFPNVTGMTYLIAPNATTSWDTQSEYDALVGGRMLLNTTSAGVQTILATDHGADSSSTSAQGAKGNGLIVEPLDISKYPGRVRFSINQKLNYTAA